MYGCRDDACVQNVRVNCGMVLCPIVLVYQRVDVCPRVYVHVVRSAWWMYDVTMVWTGRFRCPVVVFALVFVLVLVVVVVVAPCVDNLLG